MSSGDIILNYSELSIVSPELAGTKVDLFSHTELSIVRPRLMSLGETSPGPAGAGAGGDKSYRLLKE